MADYIDDLLQDPDKAQKALDIARGNASSSSTPQLDLGDAKVTLPAKTLDYSQFDPSNKAQMATKEAPYNFARNNAGQLASQQNTGYPENFSPSDLPNPRSAETNDFLNTFNNKERMGKQLGSESPGWEPEASPQSDLFDKSVNPPTTRPASASVEDFNPEELKNAYSTPGSDLVNNIATRFKMPVEAAKNFIAENPGFARTLGVLGTGAAGYGAYKDVGDISDLANQDTSKMSDQEKRNVGADIGGKAISATGNAALAGTGLATGAANALGWAGPAADIAAAGTGVGLPLALAGGAYQLGKYVNENGPEAITAMNEKNKTPEGVAPVSPDTVPPGQPGSSIPITVAPDLEHTNMVGDLAKNNTKPSADEVKNYITQQAAAKGQDPALAVAQFGQESGYNPSATSNKGAKGIGQLTPIAIKELNANAGKNYDFNEISKPENWKQNIDAGLDYNQHIRDKFNPQNDDEALRMYNGGTGNMNSPESIDYSKKILANRDKAQETAANTPEDVNRSPQSSDTDEAQRRLQIFKNTPEGQNIPPEDALLNYGPVANTPEGRAQYGQDTTDQASLLQSLKDRYTASQNPVNTVPSEALPANANIFNDVSNRYKQQDMTTPQSAGTTPTGATPSNPLQNYIDMMKQQSINNVAGLKDAQQRETNAALGANLGRAADLFSAGMIGANSRQHIAPTGQEYFKDLAAQSGNIVKNYNDLSEKEKDDPDSAYSQSMRQFMAPIMTKVGLKADSFDGMSANQINAAAPWAIKINDSADALALKKQLAEEHNAILEEHYANADALKNKTAADKTVSGQNTAYEKMQQQIKSQRGSPALAQAATAKQSIAKINDMFKTWGDPDTWSKQQVALYNQDVALVASNGRQATESTLKDTMPGGFGMNASASLGKLMNSPVQARQGDYIKQSKAYVDGIDKTLSEVINHENGNTYNSYKRALAPEQQQEYLRNNPDVIPYTMFSPKQIQGYADNPDHKMSYDLAKKELQSKVEQDLYANP